MHACAIRVICLYNILKEITCKHRSFYICCRRRRSKYVPLTRTSFSPTGNAIASLTLSFLDQVMARLSVTPTLNMWKKSCGIAIQMKPLGQNCYIVLFISYDSPKRKVGIVVNFHLRHCWLATFKRKTGSNNSSVEMLFFVMMYYRTFSKKQRDADQK